MILSMQGQMDKINKNLEILIEQIRIANQQRYGRHAEKLDAIFGEDNWREMPAEEYKRIHYESASWTVEIHKVHVYIDTGGDRQDEFFHADRPTDLLRCKFLRKLY